tara:strand:+ start:197 stop:841 length:645 start_codon:yes stop_codon:yes gene_type:complete
MFHHISYSALEYSINRAYKSRLKLCGHNAEGVFWRNQSTQIARFEMLLRITNDASPNAKTTIADIGCGYGAMLNFIEQSPYSKSILYNGVDINRSMIKACWNNFPEKTHLFKVGRKASTEVDFSLFSGTFNLCFLNNHQIWETYIFSNLKQSWLKSKFGIVLNLLCEKKANIKNQIYYANRRQFISRATEIFGPTYAISTPRVSGDVTFIITKT